MRSRDSSDLAQLTADAYYVHSLLSAAEGQLSKALFCARLCVRNCQRSWAILARSQDRKGETGRNRIIQSEQDALVGNMSELSISEQTSTGERSRTHSILCSITFWALVPRLFLGLKHLSLLYSHHGLFPEVQYYLQQSQQIAEAVDAPSLHHQSLALLGQHLIRGGNVSEGMVIIQHAEEKLAEDLRDRHYALLQLFLATYYIHSGKPQAGESAFVVAEKIIENLLTKSFVIYKQEGVGFLDTAMRELNLKDSKQIRQVSNRKRPPVIEEPLNKSADRRDASKVLIQELTAVEAPALHRLKDESIRGRIYATMCAGNFEVAASQLSEMVAHPRDHQDIVLGALLASRIHFRQGLERLVCDPVFAVIPESTISCPSIKPPSDRQGRMNRNSSPPTGRDTKSARTPSGKGLAKKPRPRDSSVAKAQPDFLRLARTDISSVFNVAKAFSPTAIVHEMSDLLVKILVMLSAVPSPMPKTPVSATALLYSLGMSSKCTNCDRQLTPVRRVEQNALDEERVLGYTGRARFTSWKGCTCLARRRRC